MSRFKDYSIRKKLSIGFGALLALLVFAGIFSLLQLLRINGITNEITQKRMFEVRYLSSVQNGINATRRSELMWLMATDKQDIAAYDTKLATLLGGLHQTIQANQEHFETIADSGELDLYKQFLSTLQQCDGLHGQVLALRQAGKDDEARAKAIAQVPYIDAMFASLEKAVASANAASDMSAVRATTTYHSALLLVTVFLALAVVVGILFTIMVSNAIVQPLNRLVESFTRAADGDLTQELLVESKDEVGEVSNAFNQFMSKLRDTLQTVASAIERLSVATAQMNDSATHAAANAHSQSGKTSQIAAASEEMTSTICEISHNTESAVCASRQSAEAAEQGGAIMNSTSGTMERIAETTNSVSEKIASLAQRSDEIGKVINVIQEISEQTNLLALNAAIESARAGEHGRGFAVVAGEVRRLAERTKGATAEIADTIRSIQEETRATLNVMQSSNSSVASGIEETNRASNALGSIIEFSKQVEQQIQLIATAASEQSAASAEIAQSATTISRLAVENAHGAGETVEALRHVEELAADLSSVIQRFRFGRQNNADRKDITSARR
jgi:methyl-accepting chemotaxis protein